jgi:hypothetical protein
MSDLAPLDPFFQRVRATNPFLDNRVNGPSGPDSDVPAVHAAAFDRLTALAREAFAARRGIGAVLWGEAGIGKSHVLARLGRWAADNACFVYLHNLQAASESLPRSLLRAVVSLLTHGRGTGFADCPLYELVTAGLLEATGEQAGWQTWSRLEEAFAALIDRFGQTELIDRGVYEVLFRFFRSANRAERGREDGRVAGLAVRWLSGQALTPAEGHDLGLPPGRHRDDPVALADDQQVKQVLVALTRLAACRQRPFLLAFDQVDNLDADQFAALSRFLEALIDGSPNLLVVTAGIQASLLRWYEEKVVQESAWHRLAQLEVRLHRLTSAEALQLVHVRLNDFLAPYAHLLPAEVRHDDLFPLGRAWHDRFLRDKVDLRPRDVINWAREGWRHEQEVLQQRSGPTWLAGWGAVPRTVLPLPTPAEIQRGASPVIVVGCPAVDPTTPSPEEIRTAIDHTVAERHAAQIDERRRFPESLPAAADVLAGLLLSLLKRCRDHGRRYDIDAVEEIPSRRGQRPDYQLAVVRRPRDGKAVRTGVLVLTATEAISTTAALRRLAENHGSLDRLLLITDERIGIPLGLRGEEFLDALETNGRFRFQRLELTFLEYAELDALQNVAGLARSGDLEVELRPGQIRRVSEAEVVESLHRQGLYLANRLLRELLGPVPELVRTADAATVPATGGE